MATLHSYFALFIECDSYKNKLEAPIEYLDEDALMQMKDRFLNAVISGELGTSDEFGVVIKLSEFKAYFSDIKSLYINSFLPAAVIEVGQYNISHTKYIFRIKKGMYRVHADAIAEQMSLNGLTQNNVKDVFSSHHTRREFNQLPLVNHQRQARI